MTSQTYRKIELSSIRKDGQTQHRVSLRPTIIAQWAEQMLEGVDFPPVTIWWDGECYWLSDGFTRCAAAELAGFVDILSEIHNGSLSDAQWSSYSANATHGVIRRRVETESVIGLALRHPNAATLSTVSMAKHLHLPEATVRYWRNKLIESSQLCEDNFRIVTRGPSQYALRIGNLGKKGVQRITIGRRDLRAELTEMKGQASGRSRSLLNIIDHWVIGQVPPARCLEVIESFLQREITLATPKSPHVIVPTIGSHSS